MLGLLLIRKTRIFPIIFSYAEKYRTSVTYSVTSVVSTRLVVLPRRLLPSVSYTPIPVIAHRMAVSGQIRGRKAKGRYSMVEIPNTPEE